MLKVFNDLGQEVETLVDGLQQAGLNAVQFDGANFSSGVYLYRMTVEGAMATYTESHRMVLLK